MRPIEVIDTNLIYKTNCDDNIIFFFFSLRVSTEFLNNIFNYCETNQSSHTPIIYKNNNVINNKYIKTINNMNNHCCCTCSNDNVLGL